MKKKLFIVTIIILLLLFVSVSFRSFLGKTEKGKVGLDQCLIEKGDLICGRSYSVISRGVVRDLVAYQPFGLSQFNPNPSILFLMDAALAKQISQFDNVSYTERQDDVNKITENYQKETRRKGSYALSVTDGLHEVGEGDSADAVRSFLTE